MKYFILCPYCNKTYIVDGEYQTVFTCPNCGAANKYGDIVSTEDDTEKIRRAAEQIVREKEERQRKLNQAYALESSQKKKQEEEDAFRYFREKQKENNPPPYFSDDGSSPEESHSYNHSDSSHNDSDSSQGVFVFLIAAVGLFLTLVFALSSSTSNKHASATDDHYREEAKRITQALEQSNRDAETSKIRSLMNKVAVSVANGYALELQKLLYGADTYAWIPNSDWEAFFENYYGESWNNSAFRYPKVTFYSGWPISNFYYDTSMLDIKPYQIFTVTDSNNKERQYTFYQNENGEWRLFLDYSDLMVPSFKETLYEIWNAVKEAALNHSDTSAIQKYFTDSIAEDDLNDLLRYVRFNLAEHEPYDGAELIDLEISCSMDGSSYDKFKIGITADYQSQSPSNPAGSYSAKIRLQYTDSGWQIYELPNFDFFTIRSEKR